VWLTLYLLFCKPATKKERQKQGLSLIYGIQYNITQTKHGGAPKQHKPSAEFRVKIKYSS